MSTVRNDFNRVKNQYDYVLVEGSGGIICPIRYDEQEKIMLKDIIEELNLGTIVVTDAKLGTINSTVLTVTYLQMQGIKVHGIIANNYEDTIMEKDNIKMIEALSNVSVIAKVRPHDTDIAISVDKICNLFEEI